MKLEIDLNDILHDGQGEREETVAESIRRQVVAAYKARIDTMISRQITASVNEYMDAALKSALADQLPGLVSSIVDYEYTPVTRYGAKQELTSLRAEIAKKVVDEFNFKPEQNSYNENAYTKEIKTAAASAIKEFQKDFEANVMGQARKDAILFVQQRLAAVLSGAK